MREMKDSGVEWMGQIPSDWRTCRLKNYCHICNGGDYKDILDDDGAYPVIGSGGEFARANKYIYDKPSVLLGRKGTINKPLYKGTAFWTVDTMYYTEVDTNLSYPRFLFYLCTQISFDYYQYGSAVPSMTQRDLNSVIFPLLPVFEQLRIADYLDDKCGKIDAIIAREKAVIEKLKEYKLSVITEAVTKGLNPDAPMKDSGVEWMGEIPKHWTKMKMINICLFFNGDRSANYPSPEDYCDDGIPFIGADSLVGKYVDCVISKHITPEKYYHMSGLKIQKDDILYTLRGSTIGKNAITDFDDGTVASSLMGIRVANHAAPSYIAYWLNSSCEFLQRDFCINGSTAPNLSADDVKRFIICLPEGEEQQQITTYLDKKCSGIDSSIAKKQAVIEKLTGYKKSLIYEVVTGKKEV